MSENTEKTGWICPVCETVNSPENKTCVRCDRHNHEQYPVKDMNKEFLQE